MINNREKNNIAKEIYEDLIVKSKEEIIDICSSQMCVIYKKEKEIEKLNSIIKEIREYIEENYPTSTINYQEDRYKLLEILDKVEENK